MRIEIPERFPVPFNAAINPFTGRVSQRFWEWLIQEDLIPTERSKERLRRSGIELASCYCWPWADSETLLLGMKWMFFFFRFDDQMEEGAAQRDFGRVCRAVEEITGIMSGNGRGPGDSTFPRSLHRTWTETKMGQPEEWVNSFGRNFCDLVRSYTDQSRFNYETPATPMGLAAYEEFREITFGMHWVYDFMEMVNASSKGYLPQQVRNGSAMRSLRRASTVQQALLNDVFSAARESHQDRIVNGVVLFQREKRCTVGDAVGYVLDRMEQLVDIYSEACHNLLKEARQCGARAQQAEAAAVRFIENMDAIIGGNHDWHHIVMRYATDDVSSPSGALCYPDDL
ncbi:hypothetical protein PV371_38575 [Streptomyces sp. TX20-6-3]|uniref:terpene synthase family protein n=1 Tax=Streptomyces sp. TX20-6-3 TaxID=3028705 RepID=UPI0029A1E920|nr:hypothetical protein [Streptomyces sp. TX20-6-3]MDX2565428.1 hypothetical protein [Streptomyces sp. TX20-6-3]